MNLYRALFLITIAAYTLLAAAMIVWSLTPLQDGKAISLVNGGGM